MRDLTAGPRRPGAQLRLTNLTRRFGAAEAVRGVSLDLAPGSFTALLGPSGCGKSTLLSLIAGLLRPDAGTVMLDDVSLAGVPSERRPVGLVFQKPLLFPHLSVEANVAFGLRMRHLPRREARATARGMLERVQLTDVADRRAGELSGGQEQRVALARALVLAPRVLLLDEPFSQLDAVLRAQMRDLVRALAEETKVTTVFVTHDQAEAVEVADEIVLMLGGAVVGQDTPEGFFSRPPSLAAARFFGVTNELAGTLSSDAFHTSALTAPVPSVGGGRPDGPATLVVRPEALSMVDPGDPGSSPATMQDALCLDAVPVGIRFAGTHQLVDLELGDGTPMAIQVAVGVAVPLGVVVRIRADAASCTVFPDGP